jgi:hypothetical protein
MVRLLYFKNISMKIANYILLAVELMLVYVVFMGTPYGHLSLGAGLGDFLIVLYTIPVIVHLIATIVMVYDKVSNTAFAILIGLFTTVLCFFIYCCTYGRGGEYRWNGEILYMGCAHYVPITIKDDTEWRRIPMCSMEYYSEIVGKSTKKNLMLLEKGDIKVPDELKSDVTQPITKFYIESETYAIKKDTTSDFYTDFPYFSVDTLQQNQSYIFDGEICKIINGIPVLQGRLREKGWISPIMGDY